MSTQSRLHEMYRILRECGEDVECGCGCGEAKTEAKWHPPATIHPYLLKSVKSGSWRRNVDHHRRKGVRHASARRIGDETTVTMRTPNFVDRAQDEKATAKLAHKVHADAEKGEVDLHPRAAALIHDKAARAHSTLAQLHRARGKGDAAQEAEMVADHHKQRVAALRKETVDCVADADLVRLCEAIRLRRALKGFRRIRKIATLRRTTAHRVPPVRHPRSAVRKSHEYNRHR